MKCDLCNSINEKNRCILQTEHSFCVICKWPLKKGHILVMPKRHVTQNEFSTLSPKETHDLFSLLEKVQNALNDNFDFDAMTFKNSGKHSSQDHFHFHVIPSKENLRKTFATHENVPEKKEISDEEYEKMKSELIQIIK